jgi:hypothetical protein
MKSDRIAALHKIGSESYASTIMLALAHENSPQTRETILELERLGWKLPVWIQRDILGR